MLRLIILSICSIVFIESCKKAPKTLAPVKAQATEHEIAKPNTSGSLVKLLKADEAFIKQAEAQKPYLMITDSLWCFYFALSLNEKTPTTNIYEGHWLDIKPDGSYVKGIYDKTIDEGKYVYDYSTAIIEFRSTLKDTSSQWTVKVDPDAMVLIGTERFNNIHWQMKLLRRSNPLKPGQSLRK